MKNTHKGYSSNTTRKKKEKTVIKLIKYQFSYRINIDNEKKVERLRK